MMPPLRAFLLRAKQAIHEGAGDIPAPREGILELRFDAPEEGFRYVCHRVGQVGFAGEEIVWKDGSPVWAMNSFGRITGEGFDPDFLREALRRVPEDAPYRGPIEYQDGRFLYVNTLAGDLAWFFGREEIYHDGVSIFECVYHGGAIQ